MEKERGRKREKKEMEGKVNTLALNAKAGMFASE